MKDFNRESESGSEIEIDPNAEIQHRIQTHFENNVVPFQEKVGKGFSERKLNSRKFTSGSQAETMSLLSDMYQVSSREQATEKLSQLRSQKDLLLSSMVAKAQKAFGVGKVSKQVIALESDISNLASLIKKLPFEQNSTSLPIENFSQEEQYEEVEYKKAA